MQRRQFIHAAAGVAGSVLSPLSAHSARIAANHARPLKIVVVGGGIVGASLALHLARAGARVTLLEKTRPTAGATQNSFAWLNTVTTDPNYRALRLRSLLDYRELDLPMGLNITWGGYLNWKANAEQAAEMHAYAAALDGTPYALRRLESGDVTALSPHVTPGPIAEAYFSAIDGHLDPVWATYRFLDHAMAYGARVQYPSEVRDFEFRRGRLISVVTDTRRVAADRVVLAAGVDTPGLLRKLGVKLQLKHAPGILAHTLATPSILSMVHEAPDDVSFKQMSNGRIVATDAPLPPDIPAHREILQHAMNYPSESLRTAHGRRIVDHVAQYLPVLRTAPLERVTLGFRPLPADDMPVLGALPQARDAYVVVTHSGVTLAPVIGQSVTQELLEERPVDLLAPYRPTRFTLT